MAPPPLPAFALQPPSTQATYSAYPATAAYSAAPVPVNVSPAPAPSAAPAAADIGALFQSLVKAGMVPGAKPPAPPANVAPTASTLASLSSLSHLFKAGGLPVKSEPKNVALSAFAPDPQAEAEREYERAILSLNIPMTASGIQR